VTAKPVEAVEPVGAADTVGLVEVAMAGAVGSVEAVESVGAADTVGLVEVVEPATVARLQ
jgi:hypothetical protein